MKYIFWLFLFFICCLPVITVAQNDALQNQASPQAIAEYQLSSKNGQLFFSVPKLNGPATLKIKGEEKILNFSNGQAVWNLKPNARGELFLIQTSDEKNRLYHAALRKNGDIRLRHIPLWLSLLPPLLAIALALAFREVVLSLFIGVWAGAFVAGGLRFDSIIYFFLSFLQVVEKYIIEALVDSSHLSIIVFSMLIGGMVAIISRNGGMAGVVKVLSRHAQTRTSTQFVTWLLGVAIFFDDYANTLIVGNTMRSATDKFKISREKLAYIVDSTGRSGGGGCFYHYVDRRRIRLYRRWNLFIK